MFGRPMRETATQAFLLEDFWTPVHKHQELAFVMSQKKARVSGPAASVHASNNTWIIVVSPA